jgi:hypothetical protein
MVRKILASGSISAGQSRSGGSSMEMPLSRQ